MELRQLRYFVAVADEGTYVRAAAVEHVAQPALWRQVRDLEAELGTRLFERAGRRVRLTSAGAELRDLAAAVLAAASRIPAAADALRVAQAGTLSVACAAPHLREILASVIAAFRATHPRVRISVREYLGGPGPGRGMLEDLLDGIVDLTTAVPPGVAGLESIPLYRSRIAVVVPDDHPWRLESVIDVARLRDLPLVTALRGSFSRSALDRSAARAGFEPTIAFESPNPSSILAAGRAGLGLAVLVEDALDAPGSSPFPVLGDGPTPIAHDIRLGWRAGVALSPAATAFVELARAEVSRRADA